MDPLIPEPFLLNPFKHHSGFLKSFILKHQNLELTKNELAPYLLKMGNCMIDLYFGDLKIPDIIGEITTLLKHDEIFDKEAYVHYLKSHPKSYWNIKLSDGSEWTLLIGDDDSRYIHIHPARGSKHTVRVRAIALKTALIMKLFHADELDQIDMVFLTNRIRNNYLDESPIKNLTYTKGIRKALAHL